MELSYFVVEHGSEIVRAVQSRLRYALKYSSSNCTIYGPMTVQTFHRLTNRDCFGNPRREVSTGVL